MPCYPPENHCWHLTNPYGQEEKCCLCDTVQPASSSPEYATTNLKDDDSAHLVWAKSIKTYYRRTCNIHVTEDSQFCMLPIGHEGAHVTSNNFGNHPGPDLVWSVKAGAFFRRACNAFGKGPGMTFECYCTLDQGHAGDHSATDLAGRPKWPKVAPADIPDVCTICLEAAKSGKLPPAAVSFVDWHKGGHWQEGEKEAALALNAELKK